MKKVHSKLMQYKRRYGKPGISRLGGKRGGKLAVMPWIWKSRGRGLRGDALNPMGGIPQRHRDSAGGRLSNKKTNESRFKAVWKV